MRVLVINSGSSSIRYGLFAAESGAALVSGSVEQVADHRHGLEAVIDALLAADALAPGEAPDAIGHRVVHGGARFSEAARIDAEVLAAIEAASALAPLHNPANLAGIEVCRARWPNVPQIAVFDTAFHQSLPAVAHRYAVPRSWFEEHGVRRYGFHGISHQYLTRQAALLLGVAPADVNLITLHLGNGASATAVRGGLSVDTSMGFTPLEGLVMGTRCGDIDPAIPGFLARREVGSSEQIDTMLNAQSGLKGLSGTQDMRELRRRADENDADALLAIDLFVYRLRKYVGAYFAVLGRVDALVFSGGIGEHHPWLWRAVCSGFGDLGVDVEAASRQHAGLPVDVACASSRVRVYVIATDEEREIVHQVRQVLA